MASPYEILGVSPDDTLDAAETAYHHLLRRQHPDLHHAEGPEAVARAEKATLALNEAIAAIRLDHRYRTRAAGPAAGTTADPGPSGRPTDAPRAGPGRTSTDEPPPRQHARPRAEPGPATGAAGAGGFDGTWGAWEGERRPGASCPFCGVHIDDLDTFDDHLLTVHEFRVFNEPRSSWFGLHISAGLRDALVILVVCVVTAGFLALSRTVKGISPIWLFLFWLLVVVYFARSTFSGRGPR